MINEALAAACTANQAQLFATLKNQSCGSPPYPHPYSSHSSHTNSPLRNLLEQSICLNLVIDEYVHWNVALPKDIENDRKSLHQRIKAAIVEDREVRLLDARNAVDRLKSQEDKLESARRALAAIEAEVSGGRGE